MICVVYVVLQRGHSGDGYDLASTLCKYDLRMGEYYMVEVCTVFVIASCG